MLKAIVNWILSILGLDKDRSAKVQSLEDTAEKHRQKLKEIEDENNTPESNVDYLNND